MKYRSSRSLSLLSSIHPLPKSGMVLLISLVIMTVLSLLLLHWYQNEIKFRMQAQSSLEYQSIYQELGGVLGQSILLLQNYTESQLREGFIVLPQSEFKPFFPEWSAQSKPAQDAHFLALELEYASSPEPIAFEALLSFHFYSLSDFPWINLSSENPDALPRNIVLSNEQDRVQVLKAPRFFLLPELSSESFDQVFYGGVRLVWEEEKIIAFQGEEKWILTDIAGDQLYIQIRGDTLIEGDVSVSVGKQVYFEIIGELILELPDKAEEFSQSSPNLFVHVTEKVILQSQHSRILSTQINGYFWIENSCLILQSSFSAIYWKGSLACHMNASFQWTVPLYLLHSPYPHPPPSSFDRTTLQLSGVRPMNL